MRLRRNHRTVVSLPLKLHSFLPTLFGSAAVVTRVGQRYEAVSANDKKPLDGCLGAGSQATACLFWSFGGCPTSWEMTLPLMALSWLRLFLKLHLTSQVLITSTSSLQLISQCLTF